MAWKLVYSHDDNGVPAGGFTRAARNTLVQFAKAGSSIRITLSVPGFNVELLAQSPESVFVDRGHVHCLAIQHAINIRTGLGGPPIDDTWTAMFDMSPAVFSTDGIERHRTPPSNGSMAEYRNPMPMSWFVDVTDATLLPIWRVVFEHDAAGNTISGNRTTLVNLVKSGVPIKATLKNINNVESSVFSPTRVVTNLGHVFAVVHFHILSFRYQPVPGAAFDPYQYDSYLYFCNQGLGSTQCKRPVNGVSILGTDGVERYRAGSSAGQVNIPRAISWSARG